MLSGPLPITMLSASIIGLLLLKLSYQCVQIRMQKKILLGDDGETDMFHAMRVQANLTEYAPVGLIFVALLEYSQAHQWVLLAAAGLLILGRLLHAWGFSKTSGYSFGRYWGTVATWLQLAFASGAGLYYTLAV